MARPTTAPRSYERIADWLIFVAMFWTLAAAFKTSEVLTVGDWDMWVDWKDREWWPLLYPLLCIGFPAISQAIFWKHFRLPIGATVAVLGLMVATWWSLFMGHMWWTMFPMTLVWSATMLPGALILDAVLFLTGNAVLTAIVGGSLFSIIFYPANWPMLAPFRLVVEQMGQLATVADVIGYTFTRTSMPEYLRIIERGTLRSFGENPAIVSALFSGFVSVIMYGVWWAVGYKLSELPRFKNAYSRYMGLAA